MPFTAFTTTGTFSFSSVDDFFVNFNITSSPNVDFSLTGIHASIPEPSTLALTAIAMASVVGYTVRRKRRT